jgi:beta-lactamase regulating signal transducer with metallopeptidase domain
MGVLSEIFYWLLNMSIIGGFTGLIVALLRKIPKFPRFAAYLLWILPLIRLWLPFGPASKWSLLNLISKFATKTVVLWQSEPGVSKLSLTNSVQAADSYFPIVYKTDLLKNIYEVAAVIWAIIAVAAILAAVFLYAATKRELHDARHLRDNIWQSDKIASPAVYGIFKAKIIIPDWVTEQELPYILAHEHVHILRRDNLWRVVAVITACVHWFNPLSWIFLKWFFTDMELACDSKVLQILGADNSKAYASALLVCSAGKSYFASSFGETRTRVRIENILSYKKLTVLSSLSFGALFVAVAYVLITNAVGV